MAIIDIKEDWEGWLVNEKAGKLDGDRVWTVLFDEADDGPSRPFMARNAPGIPKPWARHPYHKWLFVSGKVAKPKGGPRLFEVTVSYSAMTESAGGRDDMPISPLAMPPKIRWFFAVSNVPIDTDINGKPIMNSAWQAFDPAITKPQHDIVCHIERNQAAYSPRLAEDYVDAVNSDVFMGCEPGHVLCQIFTGNEIYTPYLRYYEVIYEFQTRYREVQTRESAGGAITTHVFGWITRLLDQGFLEKTGETKADGSAELENITDKNEMQLTEPVILNGAGKRIAKTVEEDPPLPESSFLKFDLHKKRPFGVLGLPV